jgi:hypothetical protein
MVPLDKHQKSVSFDDKAKVGALVQRVRAFKKRKLEEQAKETQVAEEQVLAHVVSTCQYTIDWPTRSVTG